MTLTYFVVVVYFKKICELLFSWVSFKGRVGGGGVLDGEGRKTLGLDRVERRPTSKVWLSLPFTPLSIP